MILKTTFFKQTLTLTIMFALISTGVFSQTLEAHYNFSNNLDDSSINGRNLTKTGSALKTFTTDNYANTISAFDAYDATGEYLVATGYKGISGNGERTVTAWIKLRAGGNRRTIVSWGQNSGGQMFNVMIHSGRIRVEGGSSSILSEGIVPNGSWHHVAVTFNPTTDGAKLSSCKMYIDGALQTINSSFNPGTVLNTDAATNDVRIGEAVYSTTHFFRGELNDVRVYSGELTIAQVATVMSGSTLNISDNRVTKTFKAYPNAVTDVLTIKSSLTNKLNVSVYNMLGALVKVTVSDNNNGQAKVDMNHLSSGLYHIIVEAEGNRSGLKIVKN
ncbi:LamG-like jellyroll fold domain-containing protein [Flavivirga spongiicola]|uniref:T9SS type A sorting domain-containing protein n=1 Tax=Flavivirga spongiicola TaxID=421621 RepID=A0ABU7XWT0_9FLAO|nr:LamG-like jellyroll fold domain-containing protein [Flavivirga sp. MEBiC05379]MDO5980234.1 LamG-like jellyroll fold domain-containing protein [Flavivirga sp. MEBiC05379]